MQYAKDLPQLRDYTNQGGLSRQAIFNQVNASLKRLDTDYIDLLQIHRFDPNTPIKETMDALHDLVKSGKVHYIGASSLLAVQFAQMQFVAEKNGWTKFISMQNHYSLLYREEEREMNRFCNDTGVGLIPVSCSSGGLSIPHFTNSLPVGISEPWPPRPSFLRFWFHYTLRRREKGQCASYRSPE
jgi:aryl-alcohol dehydrogenase-like predicted oxidoreductase